MPWGEMEGQHGNFTLRLYNEEGCKLLPEEGLTIFWTLMLPLIFFI